MTPLPLDPIAEARRQWLAHGWSDAADGMAAVTSLMRAQQLMLARVDAELRPLDLTFARYELLMLLFFSRTGALPLGKIGQRLQVHPTSVTSAMDKLEAQGFVRRTPHPTDRRTTLAEITPQGRSVAAAATDRLNTAVFGSLGVAPTVVEGLNELLLELRKGQGDVAAIEQPDAATR